jgi:hypothetical protein
MHYNIRPVGKYHNVEFRTDVITSDLGMFNEKESYSLATTLINTAFKLLKDDSDKFFEICNSEEIRRLE